MEAKDVALLGFVSSAQEYIKRHLGDDNKLGDLKQVNIDRLKSELLAQLRFFSRKEDINDLIEAGNQAFEEFKQEQLAPKIGSVIDQLGEIFDVDFAQDTIKDEDETVSKINDLLQAYETEEVEESVEPIKEVEKPIDHKKLPTVSIDKFISVHTKHIIDNKKNVNAESIDKFIKKVQNENDNNISIDKFIERYKEPEVSIDEFINRYKEAIKEPEAGSNGVTIDEFIEENNNEENVVPYEGADGSFGLSEDDEIFKTIASAASKSDEELLKRNVEEPKEMKPPVHPENMDEVYLEVVDNKPLSSILHSYREDEPTNYEEKLNVVSQSFESDKAEINNGQHRLSDDLKSFGIKENISDSLGVEQLVEDNIYKDLPNEKRYIENPGLNILDEEEKAEKLKEIDKQAIAKEVKNTISSGLADLKNFAKNKLAEKQAIDPEADIYNNIAKLFEHLSINFIKSTYALKKELNESAKDNKQIIILHRIRFAELEKLREFVEITLLHDYNVNVDEKQMIVDVFKEYENAEGLVLTTIYTVANQAAVLDGEYEGYRVIEKEGK